MPGKKRWLKVRNWDKWQNYRRDRGQPPWIKIHRELMRNIEWISLGDSERGQLVAIWLLAADHDGKVPADAELLRKICFMTEAPNLNKFIELEFLCEDASSDDANVTPTWRQDDANVTPTWRQDDAPETETERARARTREAEAEAEFIAGVPPARPRRAGDATENPESAKNLTPNGGRRNNGTTSIDEGEIDPAPKAAVPYREIVARYHQICVGFPRVLKLDDNRRRWIKNLWLGTLPTLKHWEDFFDTVAHSDFLAGRKANGRDFTADLEWAVKPANALKILEGRYSNRTAYEDEDDF